MFVASHRTLFLRLLRSLSARTALILLSLPVSTFAVAQNRPASAPMPRHSATFTPPSIFATGGSGAGSLIPAVADFNGDGIPDIATANIESGTVSVLLGSGRGAFQAAVNYSVGRGP